MLVIDTHIHAYPHHDTAALLSAVRRNLRYAVHEDAGCTAAIALVERAGVDVFGAWLDGKQLPEDVTVDAMDATALRLAFPDGDYLVVLAGCQIACRERIEILGLGCRVTVEDGIPAEEAIARVSAAGGVPVLAWGVGKWLFRRAAVVARLLERFGPAHLLLGDTSLRPVVWPEPKLMRRARQAGRRVLAGSDPLPHVGEEIFAGRYVSILETHCPLDGTISDWLRASLREPSVLIRSAGRRSSVREFVRRMTGRGPRR